MSKKIGQTPDGACSRSSVLLRLVRLTNARAAMQSTPPGGCLEPCLEDYEGDGQS